MYLNKAKAENLSSVTFDLLLDRTASGDVALRLESTLGLSVVLPGQETAR